MKTPSAQPGEVTKSRRPAEAGGGDYFSGAASSNAGGSRTATKKWASGRRADTYFRDRFKQYPEGIKYRAIIVASLVFSRGG